MESGLISVLEKHFDEKKWTKQQVRRLLITILRKKIMPSCRCEITKEKFCERKYDHSCETQYLEKNNQSEVKNSSSFTNKQMLTCANKL